MSKIICCINSTFLNEPSPHRPQKVNYLVVYVSQKLLNVVFILTASPLQSPVVCEPIICSHGLSAAHVYHSHTSHFGSLSLSLSVYGSAVQLNNQSDSESES